ncbi:MAG: hypothetical protein HJJLKODD_01385 [Phycisphaerae bacterium]|nr:hypothetical protein [Phycisphaerae bacterium]
MKTATGLFWSGVAAVTLMGAVGCGGGGETVSAYGEFNVSESFEGIDQVGISWRSGTITVRFDAEETQLTASGDTFSTARSIESAEAGLEAIAIDWVVNPNDASQVVLTFTSPGDSGSIAHGGNVEVVIPGGVELVISTQYGDIWIDGNVGETRVDVQIGSVQISSSNGDVEVTSESGNIDIEAQPATNGSILASTQAGTIRILVPSDWAAGLDLRTYLGAVQADLDSFTVTDLSSTTNSLTATVNGGGGLVDASSDVGTVLFGPLAE